MLTQEQLWTKAERDGICDQVLMSQTKPNELHRAKQTLNAVVEELRNLHHFYGEPSGPSSCETCRLLKLVSGDGA